MLLAFETQLLVLKNISSSDKKDSLVLKSSIVCRPQVWVGYWWVIYS